MNRLVADYHLGPYLLKQQNAYTKIDFLKTKIILKCLGLGAFVVILSLFYIWSRVQVVQIGYEINEMNRQYAELKNTNKVLKTELSLIKSPSALERYVVRQYNMSLPLQENIIEIK